MTGNRMWKLINFCWFWLFFCFDWCCVVVGIVLAFVVGVQVLWGKGGDNLLCEQYRRLPILHHHFHHHHTTVIVDINVHRFIYKNRLYHVVLFVLWEIDLCLETISTDAKIERSWLVNFEVFDDFVSLKIEIVSRQFQRNTQTPITPGYTYIFVLIAFQLQYHWCKQTQRCYRFCCR